MAPTIVAMDEALQPLGYQQIAAATLAAATPLTLPNKGPGANGAVIALLQAEAGNIRWRDDGTAPTATVGMLLIPGLNGELWYYGDLTQLQFIEATASTGILNVSYYRRR